MLETIKQAKIGSIVHFFAEAGYVDSMEYFAKLSNYGKRKNSLLIENNDFSLGSADPCMIILGKGLNFEIKGLNETGKLFLHSIKKDFGFSDRAVYSKNRIYGALSAGKRAASQEQKLKSKSHLDIIRVIARKFSPHNDVPSVMFGIISHDFLAPEEGSDHDYIFYFLDNMFVVDHKSQKTKFVANALITDSKREKIYRRCRNTIKGYEKALDKKIPKLKKGKKTAFKVAAEADKDEFMSMASRLKRNIMNGEMLCGTLSRTVVCNSAEPLEIYKYLRSGSGFYINTEFGTAIDVTNCGSEAVFRANEEIMELDVVTSSVRRGASGGVFDKDLDDKYEAKLKVDQNDIARHLMIADAARNDVSKISKPGRRNMVKLFSVDKHEKSQNLVLGVEGHLRDGLDAFNALLVMLNFNAGVPKTRAFEAAAKLEKGKRGFYTGSLVEIGLNGTLTNKTIRPLIIKKDKAYVSADSFLFHNTSLQKVVEENEAAIQKILEKIKLSGGFK
jgi:anthranilate synthase component I